MSTYDYLILAIVAAVCVVVLISSARTYIDTRKSSIDEFNDKRTSRKKKFDEY